MPPEAAEDTEPMEEATNTRNITAEMMATSPAGMNLPVACAGTYSILVERLRCRG